MTEPMTNQTEQPGPIVGIDLGTTNSVVAVVLDGQPRVLDEAGELLLPSVVGLNPQGQLVTGTAAKNQLAAFPDRTIASIKRRMGSMEPVSLGDQSFTPPEISAMILRKLRDRASRALGQPVSRAVITVPAFFDENQRQATREAAALAGLTAERIINEPTAATLVYHAGTHDRKHIAIYDFGGGTFDVSIVRMEAGVIEVLSSHGDVRLGGDDLDMELLNHVAEAFQKSHAVDLRTIPQARYRLLQACEQAKCRLSTVESVEINEEFIAEKDGQPLHLSLTVKREEFEELIEPFIDRTIRSVDEALRCAELTTHQIDDLVLVGGSTRIPMVTQRLRDEFQCEPSRAVDPDLAVALGAAVQAAMIDGQTVGPVLVDVTGHTLGVEAVVGMSLSGPELAFSPIIHRNSPLPARYERAYFTMYDGQEEVEIHVLQGERPEVHRNRSVGKFMLSLKDTGSGDRRIVVRFDLTLDGTLKVTATQSATGVRRELIVDNALSQFQAEDRFGAEERLDALFESSSELAAESDLPVMKQWRREEMKSDLSESAIDASAAAKFPEAAELLTRARSLKTAVTGQDAVDLDELCQNLENAMTSDDAVAVAEIGAELEDLIFYVH